MHRPFLREPKNLTSTAKRGGQAKRSGKKNPGSASSIRSCRTARATPCFAQLPFIGVAPAGFSITLPREAGLSRLEYFSKPGTMWLTI